VIKIRRPRRLLAVGADAAPVIEAPRTVRERTDLPRDELVARVEEVIEVPYLKPIARRRRRDRVGCPIVWPAKLEARIVGAPPKSLDLALTQSPADSIPPPRPTTSNASPDSSGSETIARTMQVLSAMAAGAAAACGYWLGRTTVGGGVFAVSLVLALLVAFIVMSTTPRASNRSETQPVAKPLKKATLTIQAAPARKTASRLGVPPCA
jgi:hypothetical protein